MPEMPRIKSLVVSGPARLRIEWRSGDFDEIDLSGWIASGDDLLRPLADSAAFAAARIDHHGFAVAWGDEHGDLAIDSEHLRLIAIEQRPFGPEEATAAQAALGMSNTEAANFLGVSPSTWATYKTGANVPPTIAMALRAAQRDPLLLHAHLRPSRGAGRPRKRA